MTLFIIGFIVGGLISWFFTRLYYSKHAKNEIHDVVDNIGGK